MVRFFVAVLLVALGVIFQVQIEDSDHYWHTTAIVWFFVWVLFTLLK